MRSLAAPPRSRLSAGERLLPLIKPTHANDLITMAAVEQEGAAKAPRAATLAIDTPTSQVKTAVAVYSCKGGVGKSTTAVSLAFTLSRLGYKVGILDADIYGPSLPTMVSVEGDARVKFTQGGYACSPIMFKGVACMSFGFLQKSTGQRGDATVVRGSMIGQLVEQMVLGTEWGALDFLIVDMPPGTGDVQLSMATTLPLTCAVVVTTPQKLAVVDVEKGIDMFKRLGIPTACLVENMAYFDGDDGKRYFPFGTGYAQHLAGLIEERALTIREAAAAHSALEAGLVPLQAPGIPGAGSAGALLVFQMPITADLCAACDGGSPFVLALPEAEASRIYARVAETVVAACSPGSSADASGGPAPGVVARQLTRLGSAKLQHWLILLDMVRVQSYN